MHRSVAASILVLIFCFFRPEDLSAEDIGTSARIWDFDSIAPADLANSSPAKDIYMTEIRANEKWNAHDLEGYLDVFWDSPQLLIVQDGEVIEGFRGFYEKLKDGYVDRERMGSSHLERVKIQIVDSDIAFALIIWTINYGHTGRATVGTNTEFLQKFDDGWKIISSHATYGDL
jgi:hypothetical protein